MHPQDARDKAKRRPGSLTVGCGIYAQNDDIIMLQYIS